MLYRQKEEIERYLREKTTVTSHIILT